MISSKRTFYSIIGGVDSFIVTDNNSTDRTREILEKYKQKGWISDIINEPGQDYQQKRWVDRMVELARKRGATWVINADADEMWYAPSGSLKHTLATTWGNVVKVNVHNMLPEEDKKWTEWTQRCIVINPDDLIKFNLSPHTIFLPARHKVAHRVCGYIQISMGNHKVLMLPPLFAKTDIRIYHYPMRSREQFMCKMVNGGKQFEASQTTHGGRHWRYFYKLYKQGLLSQEYDRVVGTKQITALKQSYIVTDDTIKQEFQHILLEDSHD